MLVSGFDAKKGWLEKGFLLALKKFNLNRSMALKALLLYISYYFYVTSSQYQYYIEDLWAVDIKGVNKSNETFVVITPMSASGEKILSQTSSISMANNMFFTNKFIGYVQYTK